MPDLSTINHKSNSFIRIWLAKTRTWVILIFLALFVPLLASASAEAQSQLYEITFYGNAGSDGGVLANISDYTAKFTGSFEIASGAGKPGALILYRDPNFLAFDVSITSPKGNSFDFNLNSSIDKFPGDSYPVNAVTKKDPDQGLLFNANGQTQRFDTPSTSVGNSSKIRAFPPNWPGGTRPTFTLVDNDSFDVYELDDGSLVSGKSLAGRTPKAAVAGNWGFGAGQGDGTGYAGIYIITPEQTACSASSLATAECVVENLVIQTNENCDKHIGLDCSANIVLADGSEQTQLYYVVSPPQQAEIDATATFGAADPVTTFLSGDAEGAYISGDLDPGDTETITAGITAPGANTARVFNYNGFNFHESRVTDAQFTDTSTMTAADIQAFFEQEGSFLTSFVFVGDNRGFADLNGNGVLDAGEPTYSANGPPPQPGIKGKYAASVFYESATRQKLNPKVLIATVEKENSLISSSVLPNATILNFAAGCGKPNNFETQLNCAARTLMLRFRDKKAFGRRIAYPFFFYARDGIQQSVTTLGRQAVGFDVNTSATYAQYRYTPFIQSLPTGGGVYLFETVWRRFAF